MAYKVDLEGWLEQMYISIGLEISSRRYTGRPPSTNGFVPVKIRWVTEQAFGNFNFRRLDKDHKETANSAEAWIYWANCQRAIIRLKLEPL